jgi:hypothetical protein
MNDPNEFSIVLSGFSGNNKILELPHDEATDMCNVFNTTFTEMGLPWICSVKEIRHEPIIVSPEVAIKIAKWLEELRIKK